MKIPKFFLSAHPGLGWALWGLAILCLAGCGPSVTPTPTAVPRDDTLIRAPLWKGCMAIL
jgi:hypothetical protein